MEWNILNGNNYKRSIMINELDVIAVNVHSKVHIKPFTEVHLLAHNMSEKRWNIYLQIKIK